MSELKETKEKAFFEDLLPKIAQKQNELRDKVLEKILSSNYQGAKTALEELQTVSVGLQVCQQSIMRFNDAEESKKQREQAAVAQANPAPMASVHSIAQPKKKRKGWFF